jgi:hypothetical protein
LWDHIAMKVAADHRFQVQPWGRPPFTEGQRLIASIAP